MEGQLLGKRYKLIEKIGGGGMALVYKARCQLLSRFVAVKILRKEFCNDEEFVRRFRVEAQAAASLSHPNIVSIFDVGIEDDNHYIVMEIVDGITLKEHIKEMGVLKWEDAVNIVCQICSAIEHAHRNHIVHRDIKPHNILYTDEGIAKVTDFGIARAATFSTVTMVGNTIGSVHYFSPEQARGGFTDEKSDIYSLGIVLYETVTGKLPYDGDTPVTVALKHIQCVPIQPIELKDDLPKGINDIIMKAIEKDQAKRYQSASKLLQDLNSVLSNSELRFKEEDRDFEEAKTKRMRAIDVNDETLFEKSVDENELDENELDEDTSDKETPDEQRSDEASEENSMKEKKRDKGTVFLSVVTALVVISILAVVAYKIIDFPEWGPPTEYTILDYKEQNFYEVKEQLEAKGIKAEEERIFSEDIEKDLIISQNKNPNDVIKLNGYNKNISFVVSNGVESIVMPDLITQDYRNAESEIVSLGLEIEVVEEFHEDVGRGIVIRTEPTKDMILKSGEKVTIYASKGPEEKFTFIPLLVGKNRMEALKLIADNRLRAGDMFPKNSTNFVDRVIRQDPPVNTKVIEGSLINIYFEEVQKEVEKRIVKETIPLRNPEKYGEKISVIVEIIPSETNKSQLLIDEDINKGDFPISVSIPVVINESTKVKVYFDGRLELDYVEEFMGV